MNGPENPSPRCWPSASSPGRLPTGVPFAGARAAWSAP